MVMLVKMVEGRPRAVQTEAARGGEDSVPAVVRNAGPKAVEIFLSFFARTKSRRTGESYRSAASQFFRWCDDRSLELGSLRAEHVTEYFEAKRDGWKLSTAKTYFRALRLLFAHLESDRVIERSPFAGAPPPGRAEAERDEQALAELEQFLRDLDCRHDRPGLVALFPIFFGTMDEERIAAVTRITREEVGTYAGRLRENSIWTEDGKIAVDFDDPGSPEAVVNMVLIIACAAGVVRRSPPSEETAEQPPGATAGLTAGELYDLWRTS